MFENIKTVVKTDIYCDDVADIILHDNGDIVDLLYKPELILPLIEKSKLEITKYDSIIIVMKDIYFEVWPNKGKLNVYNYTPTYTSDEITREGKLYCISVDNDIEYVVDDYKTYINKLITEKFTHHMEHVEFYNSIMKPKKRVN